MRVSNVSVEIIPFPLLPPHIRWFTGKYNNKEYGDILFETVDDVDMELSFNLMYGVIWGNGEYGVYEDYFEALWAVVNEDW
jgi:hypothetical protein